MLRYYILKVVYGMDKKHAKLIIEKLSENISDKPALNFTTPYELLIAVILSAQCTDERVNRITATLFRDYNTPEKMLLLSQEELEKIIFSCGLYKSKAENILKTSRAIIDKFNGQVPSTLEELKSLNGVGRKTANVVYSVAFNGQAIAVDTHVFRVSNRIGLAGVPGLSVERKRPGSWRGCRCTESLSHLRGPGSPDSLSAHHHCSHH